MSTENAAIGEVLDSGHAVNQLIDTGSALANPDQVYDDPDAPPLALVYTVPTGYHSVTVDLEAIRAPHRPGPARKSGTYQTVDVASFLAYYAKHDAGNAEIWIGDAQVTAVLDAHGGGDGQEVAAWEGHRLTLTLRPSPQWTAWSRISGKLLSQREFAEFLEDNAADVITPDMATMLEVAASLQATLKVDMKSAYRTADGQRGFRYEETQTAKAGHKGDLEIPERLTLRLRVFLGQDPVDVTARFRYRLGDNGLALGVVLDRVDDVIEAARDQVVTQITDATEHGLVLRGTPPTLKSP